MLLTRWNDSNPLGLTTDPFRRIDSLLDPVFDSLASTIFGASSSSPRINLWEDDERFTVESEVPGVSMDDLEILVDGKELTLRGKRHEPPHSGASYLRRERGTGEFTRVLSLPVPVEADRVEANLVDGVLTITLPKAAEVRPRKIVVK